MNNIHAIFKGFVKRYRPLVKIDEVATGQTWLGYDAITKGLCDDLKTSDDVLIEMVKSGAQVLRVSHQTQATDIMGWIGGLIRMFGLSSSLSSSRPPLPPVQPSLSYDDRVMMSAYYIDEFDE